MSVGAHYLMQCHGARTLPSSPLRNHAQLEDHSTLCIRGPREITHPHPAFASFLLGKRVSGRYRDTAPSLPRPDKGNDQPPIEYITALLGPIVLHGMTCGTVQL